VTLGGTAQIIGRVAAGVATGGVSEAVRYGVKQGAKSVGVQRDTLGRVVSGISTGGASEVVRYGSKAVASKLGIDPGITEQVASLGRSSINNPVDPSNNFKKALDIAGSQTAEIATRGTDQAADAPETIGMSEEEKQRHARLMADKRRKEFQNLGRSSTILTGPGGLSGSGSGQGKSLLGR
jgi:hypothetical protein